MDNIDIAKRLVNENKIHELKSFLKRNDPYNQHLSSDILEYIIKISRLSLFNELINFRKPIINESIIFAAVESIGSYYLNKLITLYPNDSNNILNAVFKYNNRRRKGTNETIMELLDDYDEMHPTKILSYLSYGHLYDNDFGVGTIQDLLESGANINGQIDNTNNNRRYTPLMGFIDKNMYNIATYLINQGADVNIQDENGKTALMQYFHNIGGNIDNEFIRILIDQTNPNIIDDDNKTALNYAVEYAIVNGNIELVQLLLNHGANPVVGQRYEITGNNNTSNQLRQLLPQPRIVVVDRPQNLPRGVAFEIHSQFSKININALNNFFRTHLPTNLPPIPDPFIDYIDTQMGAFIQKVDERDREHVRAQYDRVHSRLIEVNFKSRNYTSVPIPILYQTLEYVKKQPDEFQTAYVSSFTDECTTAYKGANPDSCTTGMIERIVSLLETAITTNSENPEYNELKQILKPDIQRIFQEIIDSVSRCYKKTKKYLLDKMRERTGKQNITLNNVRGVNNKNNLQNQLKDYVTQCVLGGYSSFQGTPMYEQITQKVNEQVNAYYDGEYFAVEEVYKISNSATEGGRRNKYRTTRKAKKTRKTKKRSTRAHKRA